MSGPRRFIRERRGVSILCGRKLIERQVTDELQTDADNILADVLAYLNQRRADTELWSANEVLDDILIGDSAARIRAGDRRLGR